MNPSLVFRGGTIWTGDPARPRAASLTVDGGRVAALDQPGEGAVVDLEGGFLLPGFRDGHLHPLHGGIDLGRAPIWGAGTVEELLAALAGYAREHPELDVLGGAGYDPSLQPDGLFDSALLDRVEADRPVVLVASDGHTCWANSAALVKAGVDAATPDPPRGRIAHRPDGAPLGTFLEAAQELVTRLVPAPSPAQQQAGLRRALAEMAAAGLVWGQESALHPDDVGVYLALAEAGEMTARVNLALRALPGEWDGQRKAFLRARGQAEERAAGQVTARTVKFFTDGIIESGTGALLEPYDDAPDSTGILNWGLDELTAAARAFDADGFQLHLHAIGDAAVRMALDAVEAVGARHRPVIAHTQLVDPADLPRFARLGVIANFEPLWAQQNAVMVELTEPRLGAERSQLQYPMGSLARDMARLSFGSDWPVSSLRPLDGLAVAVSRQTPDCQPAAGWLPRERLTLDQALGAYTRGTAWQAFDDDAGVLTEGAPADLCLLSGDPFTVDPVDIAGLTVRGTWLAGRAVYRS